MWGITILSLQSNVMNRLILLLVYVGLFSTPGVQAQKNRSDVVAGVAGAALAIGAAAMEYHLFIERLENLALNEVIENHPEMSSFRLKVLDLKGKKMSDVGGLSVMTFRVTELDEAIGTELSRSILLMFTSSGWLNQYGINTSLVSWKMMSRPEWNDLFGHFVQLNTPVPIDLESLTYGESKSIRKKEVNQEDTLQYSIKGERYLLNPGMRLPIVQSDFTRSGLSVSYTDANGYPITSTTLPFYALKNDDYIVADYSDEFKLFANERSLGLYLKNTGESLQLQRSLVSKIHQFLNRRPNSSY
jgi:hypothetical protein